MRRNPARTGPLITPIVHFNEPTVTRFAGLVPLIRYLEDVLDLPNRLRIAINQDVGRRTFPVHQVLFAFLVAALAGVAKVAHLELLRGDRVIEKMLRLVRWPVRKVFSLALNGVTDTGVTGLVSLERDIGCATFAKDETYVLNFDSSALIAYGEQEGALFGFCGWGRNRRRFNPVVASVGATGAVVNSKFRDGSSLDAKQDEAFILETIETVAKRVAGKLAAIRADSGFWSLALGNRLIALSIKFAIVLPMHPGVKLQLPLQTYTPLDGDDDIELAEMSGAKVNLPASLRVIIIRRRVLDPKAPPQGKVVQCDPNWRYQVVVTSLDWAPEDVWRFYNDRANIEHVFRDGKQSLGLDWLVSHDFRANEVAFHLRLIAYNADKSFQQAATATAIADERKVIRAGVAFRQTRLYALAGRLVNHGGSWVLRLAPNRLVRALMEFYAPDLVLAD